MRELYVVALSEDGRHAVLATSTDATRGGFRVALDDRLAAALRGELTAPGHEARAALTPKEIQQRLRAGESAEQIAASAGVPVARIERFSGPVAGERLRTIEAARATHLVRGRRGRSALPLGRAVDTALAAVAVLHDEHTVWSARRDEDGTWLVQVFWQARGRARQASWHYDVARRQLTAADPASATLGHADGSTEPVERRGPLTIVSASPVRPAPARRAATKSSAKPAAKPAAKSAAKPAAERTPAAAKSRATAPPKSGVKAPAKGTAPAPRKSAAKSPAKTKPATKTAAAVPAKPAAGSAARAATTRKAASRTPGAETVAAAVPRAPAKRRASPTRPVRLTVVPDAPANAAETKDGVRKRSSVPGWADVLLSTGQDADVER